MAHKRILTSEERKVQLARIHAALADLRTDLPAISSPSLKSLWDAETARQKRHV